MSQRSRQHGRIRAKIFLVVSLLLFACTLYVFHRAPMVYQDEVCKIFYQYPSWYRDAKKVSQRWQLPIPVQMAIIHQESHFRATAKPVKAKLLGIFTVHTTSAVGYSQAVNETWRAYLKQTNQISADREDFSAASDFIGWFSEGANKQLGIRKSDAYRLYLAYHEGLGGYQRQSYRSKPWLEKIARQVEQQAKRYQVELIKCRRNLDKREAGGLSAAPLPELLRS